MTDDTDIPCPPDMPKFALKWIAAHEGVTGNERVDEEAKRAAQGESSPPEELPPHPSQTLANQRISDQAGIRGNSEDQVARNMDSLSVIRKIQAHRHILSLQQVLKISSVLSRAQTSLLIQLRTGQIPLNSYLHRIKKSDTRRCVNCWDAGRGSIIETVIHYLFECQAYAVECYDMDRALGRMLRDLQGILASLDKIKELLKFMGRTSRFKTRLGDAIGDVSHLDPEEG